MVSMVGQYVNGEPRNDFMVEKREECGCAVADGERILSPTIESRWSHPSEVTESTRWRHHRQSDTNGKDVVGSNMPTQLSVMRRSNLTRVALGCLAEVQGG
eukprot:GHVU01145740.1.p2 GENE.GHVU01145740.1~~GHVU01145740.1.p2  ORF type:complete len:101 (+),score=2.25 GHVU01145740.1:323-625(+)